MSFFNSFFLKFVLFQCWPYVTKHSSVSCQKTQGMSSFVAWCTRSLTIHCCSDGFISRLRVSTPSIHGWPTESYKNRVGGCKWTPGSQSEIFWLLCYLWVLQWRCCNDPQRQSLEKKMHRKLLLQLGLHPSYTGEMTSLDRHSGWILGEGQGRRERVRVRCREGWCRLELGNLRNTQFNLMYFRFDLIYRCIVNLLRHS